MSRRRKSLGLGTGVLDAALGSRDAHETESSPLIDPVQPSTDLGLLGLSLSGGGIRSATISLGVIQALAEGQCLRLFDYLSSVSGGGYVAACLSSLLNNPQAEPDGERFPLAHRIGRLAGKPLRRLLNSGSYLTPGGLIDRLRIPTVILRGILLNLLIFLPYLMLAVILTEFVYETGAHYLSAVPIEYLLVSLGASFLGVVVLFPVAWRLFHAKFTWRVRNAYELLTTALLGLCLLALTLIPFTLGVQRAINVSWPELTSALAHELDNPFEHTDIWKWAVLLGVVLAALFAGQASTRLKSTSNRLLIYLLSLLGPAVLLVLYLIGCVIQIDSPWLSADLREPLERKQVTEPMRTELAKAGVALSATGVDIRNGEKPDEWWIDDGGREYLIRADGDRLRVASSRLWDDRGDLVFLGVLGGLFLFNLMFLNVNVSSGHGFYRDRLSAAYLFKVNDEGDLEPNDTLKLSELNEKDTKGPYHLINVALNLQGSSDPTMRDRRADFFILSSGFTGSDRTGYWRTSKLEELDEHVDLGTALAISGAAASPNMGVTTLKPLVFILTLLNIRLGYWLPNPAQQDAWRRRFLPTPWLLLRESVSAVDDSGPYVNISDGGHLENLGAYELLRRRCKLIVAIDAEADPNLFFGALVKLIRYARIDLGIEIDIDLEPLRAAQADGRSTQQWAVGKIRYGDTETGSLLYMKSTLAEDLASEDIRDYLDHQPAFPHQPTSDQFFDEAQFEAYRSLGYQIASRALDDPQVQELFAESRSD